jgi:hypothetical protein
MSDSSGQCDKNWTYSFTYRKVYGDLIVEQEAFFVGMETLEEAIRSFFHFCSMVLDEIGTKSALRG